MPAQATRLKELEFHHVKFTGTFLNKDELYRHAISHGRQAGLSCRDAVSNSQGGGIVFVDRGFVPKDRRDPATRAEGEIAGEP